MEKTAKTLGKRRHEIILPSYFLDLTGHFQNIPRPAVPLSH